MLTRQTRNSRDAAEDAALLVVPSGEDAVVDPVDLPRNGGNQSSGDSMPAGNEDQPSPRDDQPSPQFLATVIAAVKSAFREERQDLSSVPGPSSQPPVSGVARSLDSQAQSFIADGAVPVFGSVDSRGRSVTFPSFVKTFARPVVQSVELPVSSHVANSSTPPPASVHQPYVGPASVLPPPFQLPFIVGPGYSPVPYKLVSQIVSGKFVDLADLLSENLVNAEPEPQVMFDGRLVLAAPPKKPRRQLMDIAQWVEAFTIFTAIIVSHFPRRWKDLLQYKLLILRTHRQYFGRVWYAYDVAFREQAAASRLSDWSQMDVQLFNFHAAGAPVKSAAYRAEGGEPVGNNRASSCCISWNSGKCSAPSMRCKYAHSCITCGGDHRRVKCSRVKSDKESRRHSVSPPPKNKKR